MNPIQARAAVFCVGALLAGSPRAQEPLRHGEPAEVDMSGAVLRAGATLFEDAVARDDLRGAVVLVVRRGVIVLHQAFGWRDLDKTQPMAADTLFRMASNTKPVIAAAILQLIEQDKLGLDDKVGAHLPSFDNDRAGDITIRHLLSHTSGLRIRPIFLSPLIGKSSEHPDAPSLRVEVARFGAIGAAVPPGTSYSYSNPGFNTLGALVEVASGTALKDYLQREIYQPLGMTDSCNHESDADPARMSTVFRRRGQESEWRIQWQPGDPPDYPFPRASGGMISTVEDYAAFCQMWLGGGNYRGARVLSEDSVIAATAPQTEHVYSEEQRRARTAFYGFGWSVARDGVYSHGGSDGTWAWVDPQRQLIGLVFTQSPGGRNPREQFRRVVDAACSEAAPSGVPSSQGRRR